MPNAALRTILPAAGWSADGADAVTFSGGTDPVIPTPFRVGVAGAATLAATGLAASALWDIRTGRRQSVAVDLRQATASLRSGHYMKLGDGEVSYARNSIMGVYPTKDGRWSYLHCNFPNHRAAALSVLGVPEDRAAVARRGAELERRRPGGGDHRRQGCRRHGAQPRGMGAASAGRRDRRLAVAGDRPDRRRAAGATARAASGRCRAFACST